MKKIIFVFQMSYYYFRMSLQTLYEGLRNPNKFYEEEKKQAEIIKRVMPALVASSLLRVHEENN